MRIPGEDKFWFGGGGPGEGGTWPGINLHMLHQTVNERLPHKAGSPDKV